MAAPTSAAAAHYAARKQLAVTAAAAATALWSGIDTASMLSWWAARVPLLGGIVARAQLAAAQQAQPYAEQAAADAGVSSLVEGVVAAAAFAGIASDGRALLGLLMQPVLAALRAIGAGADVPRALATGEASLDMITRTQVADAGRLADQAALTVSPAMDGYVRVVVGDTCNRCLILAGRFYTWSEGFERHPRCDCVHLPAAQASAAKLIQDPREIYDALTPEQRTAAGWSQSEQEALNEGADIIQVTNAATRPGSVFTAGGREFTREGTTRRGLFGGYVFDAETGKMTRRPRGQRAPARLTVDQILIDAQGDRDRAVRLLRENAYLTTPAVAPVPANRVADIALAAARARSRAEGQQALDAVPVSSADSTVTPAQRSSLAQYRGTAYSNINGFLRRNGGKIPARGVATQFHREITRDIDSVMAQSKLTSSVRVYRGITSGESVFGPAWDGELTGAQWAEHGYLSTSADRSVAERPEFTGADGALLIVRAPRGTGAVRLSGGGYESEILIGRGQQLRVLSDTGPGASRVLEAEILPSETAEPDLATFTVPQLRTLARARGIRIPAGTRKDGIVAILQNGDAGPSLPPDDDPDLTTRTVAQLRQLAATRGVRVLSKDRKADLIAKLTVASEPPGRDTRQVRDARAHLRAVSSDVPADQREPVGAMLDGQAALSPVSAMGLRAIRWPDPNDASGYAFSTRPDMLACYDWHKHQMYMNQFWATEPGLMAEAVDECRAAAWFSPSAAGSQMAHILAHEYGHHVGYRVHGSGDDLTGQVAARLLPVMTRALRTRNKVGGRDLLAVTDGRISGEQLNAWIKHNEALIGRKVSSYGTTRFNEMIAEIWQEYSTMGGSARPHIKAIGDVLRDIAEGR